MRRYLVLAAAALVAFGDALRGSFHFDDYTMLANPAGPPWFLQTRPLTQLTFWLNSQVNGTNPFGFHLVNLLLHIAVVCLLFRVLSNYLPADTAICAAALFAIHPIQSESVAYVFARSTLLATMFCLLCWRAWQSDRPWRAVAWFGLALVCKEDCVTFPFMLLLLGPRLWRPFAVMLTAAAAVGLHTIYATKIVAGSGAGFTAGVTPLAYLLSQGPAMLRYVRLIAIPWGLTIDPTIENAISVQLAAWSLVVAALVFLRKNRWFIAGMILLIPSSSIFPAADLAADRRLYLPMAAFCVAIALLVQPLKRIYLVPVALVLVVLSIGRMEVWRTERSLWQEAVEGSPDKARPRIQLSRVLPSREALDLLGGAPLTPDVAAEMGRIYLDLGRPADALREFGHALALSPGDAHAVNNRGVALLALGQKEAARRDFELALKLDPALVDAHRNLARVTAEEK